MMITHEYDIQRHTQPHWKMWHNQDEQEESDRQETQI